jgi:hypothetical protein
MTGFIMHYCSKPKFFTAARVFLLALLLMSSLIAKADGIEVKSAELEVVDETLVLKADLEIGLSPALEEALNKGVPLNFVAEFELKKPRWYWLDEIIVTAQQHIRLSYHALTRQFQLTNNGQYQNFSSLNDARRELGRLQGWPVVEKGLAKKHAAYVAGLRMKLDLSQLPKPLQVNALASKDWNLDSEWHRWNVTP